MKKIKLIFLAILLISWSMELTGVYYYPAIIFPHFKNKKMGKEVRYISTSITSNVDKNKINIETIIKPHDKRFMLFSIKSLQDSLINNQLVIDFFREECGANNFLVLNKRKHHFVNADN